jgi:hypothetical protein
MGTNDEIQNANRGKTPLFPISREDKFTHFVCKWRALENERACAETRLDCFSKEISEKLTTSRGTSWQGGGLASTFQKSFLGNFMAS